MKYNTGLLNIIHSDVDLYYNEKKYKKESSTTSVIYRIENLHENKSYIGRTKSFNSRGRKGGLGRFCEHWSYAHSNNLNKKTACPVFYKKLRSSSSEDWFVYTIRVCQQHRAKDLETYYIKKYDTCNPEYGYNVFVGNDIPNNPAYLAEYKKAKVTSNVKRAVDGSLKRTIINKKLPPNIYRHIIKKNNSIIGDGYRVSIKINDIKYKKIFTSLNESLATKLDNAKNYLALVKQKCIGLNVSNALLNSGAKRTVTKSLNLPKNIRYIEYIKNGIKISEGYMVEIYINKKRYCKRFLAINETMNIKLQKAIDYLANLKNL